MAWMLKYHIPIPPLIVREYKDECKLYKTSEKKPNQMKAIVEMLRDCYQQMHILLRLVNGAELRDLSDEERDHAIYIMNTLNNGWSVWRNWRIVLILTSGMLDVNT